MRVPKRRVARHPGAQHVLHVVGALRDALVLLGEDAALAHRELREVGQQLERGHGTSLQARPLGGRLLVSRRDEDLVGHIELLHHVERVVLRPRGERGGNRLFKRINASTHNQVLCVDDFHHLGWRDDVTPLGEVARVACN